MLALGPAFIGILAGRWTRDQINEEQFQNVFLFAVLFLGAYLVWRALKPFAL
jgi:uncharacterized membrane protein YfcA